MNFDPDFDINTDYISPISTPLRRVPPHQQEIVKELLDHNRKLGLTEPIDSPLRAATVLIQKKNVAASSHVTDKYRLCIDYRFLNNVLPDSGWPAPSLSQCIDAVLGSAYLSAFDFSSGYHQIPCTDRAKQAIAFSPGYGFGQWTWNVMPQGIKPASHTFQRAMDKTFHDLVDCVSPPSYGDINVKGNTFDEHKDNVARVLQRVRDSVIHLECIEVQIFPDKTTISWTHFGTWEDLARSY